MGQKVRSILMRNLIFMLHSQLSVSKLCWGSAVGKNHVWLCHSGETIYFDIVWEFREYHIHYWISIICTNQHPNAENTHLLFITVHQISVCLSICVCRRNSRLLFLFSSFERWQFVHFSLNRKEQMVLRHFPDIYLLLSLTSFIGRSYAIIMGNQLNMNTSLRQISYSFVFLIKCLISHYDRRNKKQHRTTEDMANHVQTITNNYQGRYIWDHDMN